MASTPVLLTLSVPRLPTLSLLKPSFLFAFSWTKYISIVFFLSQCLSSQYYHLHHQASTMPVATRIRKRQIATVFTNAPDLSPPAGSEGREIKCCWMDMQTCPSPPPPPQPPPWTTPWPPPYSPPPMTPWPAPAPPHLAWLVGWKSACSYHHCRWVLAGPFAWIIIRLHHCCQLILVMVISTPLWSLRLPHYKNRTGRTTHKEHRCCLVLHQGSHCPSPHNTWNI